MLVTEFKIQEFPSSRNEALKSIINEFVHVDKAAEKKGAEIEYWKEELEKERDKLFAVSCDVLNKEKCITELNTKNDVQNHKLDQLQQSYKDLDEKHATLGEKHRKLIQKCSDLERIIVDHKQNHAKLGLKHEQLVQKCNAFERSAEVHEQNYKVFGEERVKLLQQCKELKQVTMLHEGEIKTLQLQLQIAANRTDVVTAVNEERAKQEQKYFELEKKYSELQDNNMQLNQQAQRCRTLNGVFWKILGNVRNEVNSAPEIVTDMASQFNSIDAPVLFECFACKKDFLNFVHLKNHVQLCVVGSQQNSVNDGIDKPKRKYSITSQASLNGGPFVCKADRCGKKYQSLGALKKHSIKHNNDKLYACKEPNCLKTFDTKWDLKRHGITHSGEKPFFCTVCNRKFTQSGNLNKHKAKHH